MVRREELISEARHKVLTADILANLTRDFGSLTETERHIAIARHAYVRAIYNLPSAYRDRKEKVEPAIDAAGKAQPGNIIKHPTYRQVRNWYLIWVSAGFDIRSLVPQTSKRGNYQPRYEPWIYEEIDRAIDEVYATPLKGSVRQTLLSARRFIRLRADRERLALPNDSKQVIGRKVIELALARRGQWEILVKREGHKEADRLFRLKGAGPDGEYPLGEVEVDHTLLDVIVKVRDVILGRPWLTVLIDRYSRMILGFAIDFVAPSWVSVMQALRHAVMPKDEELKRWAAFGGAPFVFEWPCFGAPDVLYVDRGREFHSASMIATEACLNMRICDLPKASGDKKGKVESLFNRMNKELIHTLDGATLSNPKKRGAYDPVRNAMYSPDDIRYLVTRYIVDYHNRTRHPGTGEIPAERWRRGMDEVGLKPAPPRELLAPITGKVLNRKLRDDGVRYNKLRWNSNAFRALRERIGPPYDVLIRIDPLDITTAYILDPESHKWIEGELKAESDVEKLTLSQYETLRNVLNETAIVDDDYELKIAKGWEAIDNFVSKARLKNGVLPKRVAAFVTQGSRAIEHIHGEREDPEASSLPIAAHDVTAPILSPPPNQNAPYRDTVINSPNHYPVPDAAGRYPGELEPPCESETPNETDTSPGLNEGASQCGTPMIYPGRYRDLK
jgi:putative transposase